MGRRKSKTKNPMNQISGRHLPTQFDCPFCNHEKSCEVNMDRSLGYGRISCRVCMEDYQSAINYLSEPIDVYSDWIDACEQANN